MKKTLFTVAIVLITGFMTFAQEDSTKIVEFDLGADIASSYVWRGLLFDNSPNIQGWGELAAGSFFAGIWASTNFTGTYAETDVYAGVALGNLTATFTDYFTGYDDVFNFDKLETWHAGELMLQYTISEDFPLQITAATIIYGADLKLDSIGSIDEEPYFNEESNYSTYFELMYPFSIGSVDLEFAIGGTTHDSYFYATEGAALTNISLKSSKAIKVTNDFELPVSFQLVVNPELKSVYSVFVLSF
ncbi:MAG: hypothetical protein ABFS35_10880 [Bacteroidota bacterium]